MNTQTNLTFKDIEAIVQICLQVYDSKKENASVQLKARYSKEDVCKLLGISQTTLDRRRKEGAFPNAYADGGCVFFPAEDVKDYLASVSKASK